MSGLPEWVTTVACYLRRSREDLEAEKRGENTLLAQRDLMTCEVLPRFPVQFEVYEEVASGDTIKDRPVFQQLLFELEQGVYQAIAVKDLTRLGRGSYGDMGKVYDLIRDRRVFIITSNSVFDPENPDDLRNIRFSMFLSREEYEAIVFRLVQGKYNQVRHRGHWVAGVTPYGYDYNRDTRKLRPNQDADTVRLIYHLFVDENMRAQAISNRLRQLGIHSPAGKEYWNPQTIRRMLANPVYIGTVSYRRTKRLKTDGKVVTRPQDEQIVVSRAHAPIVADTVWNFAQQKINRPQPKTPREFSPTELAGIIRCAACGRKMIRQSSKQVYRRKSGDLSTYEKEFLACISCGYWVQYRTIEGQLLNVLQALAVISKPKIQRELEKQTLKSALREEPRAVLKNLCERREAVLLRLARARDFVLDGTFTKTEFEADRSRHQGELQALNKAIAELEVLLRSQAHDTSNLGDANLADISTLFHTYQALASKDRKNALLRTVFSDVELVFLGKQGRHNRFELSVSLAYENLL